MISHTFEHLEVKQGAHPVGLGQGAGIGQLEQIVRGDAQTHGTNAVGLHAVGDHPLIVGIHLQLVVIGGQRPVVQRGLKLFHFHIGALDDAQLDRRTTPGNPLHGPVCELLLDGKAVGQIGLQDNAG